MYLKYNALFGQFLPSLETTLRKIFGQMHFWEISFPAQPVVGNFRMTPLVYNCGAFTNIWSAHSLCDRPLEGRIARHYAQIV